jgi:RecB family exonuclease
MSILKKCPREWYLRYIAEHYLSIPQPWSDFGLLIHEVSELYRGEGKEKLIELTKQLIKKHKYKIHDDYLPKVPLALKNYKKYYDTYLASAKSIKREVEFRTDLNDYVDLVGLIDILYQSSEGEWVVVDLKTSKNKGDHSDQLALYYFLMSVITGKKPKKLRAQVVYLSMEDGSTDMEDVVEEYVLEHDDLKVIEQKITGCMEVMTNCGLEKEKWRKKPSALCNYCAYKEYGLCNAKP